MTVDGQDVKEYGVQQWNLEHDYSQLSNESEWPDGAVSPLILPSTIGFKKIKATIMIRGSDRKEIWEKAGKFIANLLTPREYSFDGFNGHYFYGYLKNASQAETCLQRWHKATLELCGYEYGELTQADSEKNVITLTNAGTLLTPAIVKITPVINLTDITLTGLVRNATTREEKNITVKNLTNGKTVIIDGETGLITENGINKYSDVDLWDLPSLVPGINKITANKDINITVQYKPRYF